MRVEQLYGGGLYLPGECAPELLAAFGRATADAPDELTLSVAFLTLPDLDVVPVPVRGRFVAPPRGLPGQTRTQRKPCSLRSARSPSRCSTPSHH